jgi:hypothetical protein
VLGNKKLEGGIARRTRGGTEDTEVFAVWRMTSAVDPAGHRPHRRVLRSLRANSVAWSSRKGAFVARRA